MELLLERGADVHRTDVDGATALHKAAFSAHAECVSLLLKHGAVTDTVDQEGLSALHRAVFRNVCALYYCLALVQTHTVNNKKLNICNMSEFFAA